MKVANTKHTWYILLRVQTGASPTIVSFFEEELTMHEDQELIERINSVYKECGINQTVDLSKLNDAPNLFFPMPSAFKPTKTVLSTSSGSKSNGQV